MSFSLKSKLSFALLLLFATTIQSVLYAQNVSTKGYDFWFGMPKLGGATNPEVIITSTVSNSTEAIVEIPGQNFYKKVIIAPYSSSFIELPGINTMNWSEGTFNTAIHVSSDHPVQVHAIGKDAESGDGSIIYPVGSLRDKYTVLNYSEPTQHNVGSQNGESILIVATEDNSQIQITRKSPTSPQYGTPYTITLNKGQVYQIISQDKSAQMTGTIIENPDTNKCLRFAVFSSNIYTTIGGCQTPSNLFEQAMPDDDLGNNYVLIPFSKKNITAYRVMAIEDSTKVTFNHGASSSVVVNLNKGQVHQFFNNIISYAQSDKPVSIFQYAQGKECDGSSGIGAPFALQQYANHQFVNEASFSTAQMMDTLINEYWLNIITRTSDVGNMLLDGQNISGSFSSVASHPNYSFAKINLPKGFHSLSNTGGFMAYMYAWGESSSYAYTVGANLKTFATDSNDLISVYAQGGDLCIGESMKLKAQGYPSGGTFQWYPNGENADEINVSPRKDVVYRVTYKRAGSCPIAEDTAMIHIRALPDVAIIPQEITTGCNYGNEIILRGYGAQKYRWWTATGEDYGNDIEARIQLSQQVNKIYLEGTNEFGCKDTTFTIWYPGKCCELFIPNAFSPNGDGVNDVFQIKTINPVKSLIFEIYNRFGHRLYISRNENDFWDGTLNGKPIDLGTYFYHATGTCMDGSPIEKRGTITLVR